MFSATLSIPDTKEVIGSNHVGLSDEHAISFGRIAAWALPDDFQGYVIATLTDGSLRTFAVDWTRGEVVIGRVPAVKVDPRYRN